MTADGLFREAKSLGADRIAFRVGSTFKFSRVREGAIQNLLQEASPESYKYQRREGTRWRDLRMPTELAAISQSIKAISSGSLASLTASDLGLAAQEKPAQFEIALIKYLRHSTNRFGKHFNHRALAGDLAKLDDLAARQSVRNLEYVRSTLGLYVMASKFGLEDAIAQKAPRQLLARIREAANGTPGRYSSREGQIALNMLLGKLYSLFDRDSAANHFRLAHKLDADGLISLFYIDTGSATYFTHEDIEQPKSTNLSATISSSLLVISNTEPVSDSTIAISVDPQFFRIYAPTFLYYAQQLTDVDYTIIICGDESEARQLMQEGRDFLSALDTLNRNGTGANVHWCHIPVPEYVVDQKTFYASARFFAASRLLHTFSHLTLLDADMTAEMDPRPHLRRTSRFSFAAVGSSGLVALSPWRRNLAGNVAISREAQTTGMLSDICSYLSFGLAFNSSWMLDQNALTFGIERHPMVAHDLSDAARPFTQNAFRETWERNYFSS